MKEHAIIQIIMEKTDLILTWSKLLPLKEEEIEKLGNIGAVFRISKKQPDEKYYVCFVGSTSDLKNELSYIVGLSSDGRTNYDKGNYAILKMFITQSGDFSFRYAPVEDGLMQKAIEKQMYKHYAPEYNLKEPVSNLDVKLNLN